MIGVCCIMHIIVYICILYCICVRFWYCHVGLPQNKNKTGKEFWGFCGFCGVKVYMYPVCSYYCEKEVRGMAAKCEEILEARKTVKVINANVVRVEFLADQRVRGD